MANTPPSVFQLVPTLRDCSSNRPDQLRGALEGRLLEGLGAAEAKHVASTIVDEHAFDNPEVLAEVTPAALKEMGLPVGRHSRVMRALFGESHSVSQPNTPAGQIHFPPAAPVINVPAPVVNVTASASDRGSRTFKTPWPSPDSRATPSPELFRDFGMSLRVFLRQFPPILGAPGAPASYTSEQWADMTWDRFLSPWTDISDTHSHGGSHDKVLCAARGPLRPRGSSALGCCSGETAASE